MSDLEGNDNSSSGSEELEDAVEDLDCADRDNCDKEITKLIYERVKRKSWATNSRNTCKHLRARAMLGWGPFNDYVEKMRGVRGSKNSKILSM